MNSPDTTTSGPDTRLPATTPNTLNGRCFYCAAGHCRRCAGDGCTHEHVRLPSYPEPETTPGGQR